MNQIILVGRLNTEPTVKELESCIKTGEIILAVQRSWKNTDGIYETDFIPCVIWSGIASNVKDYCHKGDVVGVKERLQTTNGKIEVIAEKVTFLSSKGEK